MLTYGRNTAEGDEELLSFIFIFNVSAWKFFIEAVRNGHTYHQYHKNVYCSSEQYTFSFI
jgi:hypothetical protein